MPVIPSNSNLALLKHAIEKFADEDAMEMFIMIALVNYCTQILEIDLTEIEQDSEEFNTAYNLQQMAGYLLDRINMKHQDKKA